MLNGLSHVIVGYVKLLLVWGSGQSGFVSDPQRAGLREWRLGKSSASIVVALIMATGILQAPPMAGAAPNPATPTDPAKDVGQATVRLSLPPSSNVALSGSTQNANSLAVQVGQTFALDATVEVVTGSALGWQFGLTFDPAVVQVASITQGTWLSAYAARLGPNVGVITLPWDIDNTHGSVLPGGEALIGTSVGPGSGTYPLATIRFVAVGRGDAAIQALRPIVTNRRSLAVALTAPPAVPVTLSTLGVAASLTKPAAHFRFPATPLLNGKAVPAG